MNISVFLSFDDHPSAVAALDIIATNYYEGESLGISDSEDPERITMAFIMPQGDAVNSTAGKFCRTACEYLGQLGLNPEYGLV